MRTRCYHTAGDWGQPGPTWKSRTGLSNCSLYCRERDRNLGAATGLGGRDSESSQVRLPSPRRRGGRLLGVTSRGRVFPGLPGLTPRSAGNLGLP
jgi:hypothetical protein